MVGRAKLNFRPALVPTLVVMVLLPALLWLAAWQQGRADEKRHLISLQEQQMLAVPVQLDSRERDLESLRYRQVWIEGEYDREHQFLLDNQVVNGKAGFHVMTPFHIKGTSMSILVNRGWLKGSADRKTLPDVTLRDKSHRLSGMISAFPGVGYELAGAEVPSGDWPAVVQLIKTPILTEHLGYPLLPYQLWLDESFSEGYHRDWQIRRYMTPEKHIGYALQWLSLALLVLVFYLWRGFKTQ